MIKQTEYGLKRLLVRYFMYVAKCCPATENFRPCPECSKRLASYVILCRKLLDRAYPDGVPSDDIATQFDPGFAFRLKVKCLINDNNGIGAIFHDEKFKRDILYQVSSSQVEKICLGQHLDDNEEGGVPGI